MKPLLIIAATLLSAAPAVAYPGFAERHLYGINRPNPGLQPSYRPEPMQPSYLPSMQPTVRCRSFKLDYNNTLYTNRNQ